MSDFEVNKGAFVNRVFKGDRRVFFSVSLPLEYLEGRVPLGEEQLARRQSEVGRRIAAVLDGLFRRRHA